MSLVQTLPGVHEDLDDLHLALFEALSNAVIHGNQEDQGKTVDICAGSQGRAHVLIAVTDQGGGFDPAILQDLTSAENILAGHGRGVFLMRQLVEEVEFNLGGRQVVLHTRIASQPEIIDLTDGAMRALGR